ncbi:MAG: DRTGG domain-containing protein [Candidatus Eisenbacteria bacterium]
MKLREIKEILQATVVCGEDHLDEDMKCAGASDLMSDVLAFGRPGMVLLTGLANTQSVRTAIIVDAKALVYVRGKTPATAGVELAREKSLPIISTQFTMYKASGLLFSHGLPGVFDYEQSQ